MMRSGVQWAAAYSLLFAAMTDGGSARAQIGAYPKAIIAPGGGFLVADGSSIVALQITMAAPRGSASRTTLGC